MFDHPQEVRDQGDLGDFVLLRRPRMAAVESSLNSLAPDGSVHFRLRGDLDLIGDGDRQSPIAQLCQIRSQQHDQVPQVPLRWHRSHGAGQGGTRG